MKHLHIDIETFCEIKLLDVGVYRYVEDPTFKIILFAYAWDNDEPIVIDTYNDDFPGESIPINIWNALTDPNVLKIAHNANFEMTCIGKYFGIQLDSTQWFCTQVGAAYLGLPLSLDHIGKVLNLSQQKDSKGKSLITFFSMPCKPTKKNEGRTINLPEHNLEKWELFKEYNAQDVRTEVELFKYLKNFESLHAIEWEYWKQDQKINTRGVMVDVEFIDAAIEANNKFLANVHYELVAITGIDNPNSLVQLKTWLKEKLDHPIKSLAKEQLQDHLNSEFVTNQARRVLELRRLSSKTSVSKYDAMKKYVCKDNRIRGLFQFYGANRTGRFAGRGVQVHNLKRTLNKGLETAREAVCKGIVDLLYDDVPEIISKLIRTALITSPGYSIVASDFSAIEARVLAWLSGEEWVLEVFRTHGKLYEATASKMFNVPLEELTKSSDLRQKGKVASLALGYQGASGALITMGALRQGLEESELSTIVKSWRGANTKIVKLWRECEAAAKHVIAKRTTYALKKAYTTIKFNYECGYLFITLPSGRRLSYYGANVKDGKLMYWGVDQKRKMWAKIDTYGGALVENITQAIARDCLVDAMYRMQNLNIIMHVHDEIVVEAKDELANDTLSTMNTVMSKEPDWAVDLPLSSSGYVSKFYKKD